MTDPLKRTWKYEYDNAGDKIAETDPEGDKHTWGYNEDSQETSMVSPRGHVKAGEESKYTTTTERDAQGRPIKAIDPLKHEQNMPTTETATSKPKPTPKDRLRPTPTTPITSRSRSKHRTAKRLKSVPNRWSGETLRGTLRLAGHGSDHAAIASG